MPQEEKKELQLVVFKIGNEEFGVEIAQVREIVRLLEITYMPKAPEFIEGVVNLRGQIVPIIDLAKRMSVKGQERGENTRIVIIEIQDNTVGMIVDSVSEVLRLPADGIEDVPGLITTEVPEQYIQGVGKLTDRLLVLLNLDCILTQEEVSRVKQHVDITAETEEESEEA